MSNASIRERYRLLTGGLVAASLVATYSSWDFYSFGVLKEVNPEMAYTLRPDDPDAFTAAMRQRILKQKAIAPSDRDVDNAKASLKNGALNRAALRTIGFGEDVAGRGDDAERALALADQISRRDPLVQMWLIESNRRAGQRLQNVDHYAAAMSVEPKLITVLGPGIIEQLQYPDFQKALVGRMAGAPAWADELSAVVAQSASIPDGLKFLATVAKADPTHRYIRSYATMALRLATSDDSGRVVSFLKSVDPEFDVANFGEAGWNTVTTNPDLAALAWSSTARPGVSIDLGTPGSAYVSLEPLARAIITSRAILVKGGRGYRLSLTSASDSIDASGYIDVVAECATTGQRAKLAQYRVTPTSTQTEFDAEIAVPAQCNLLNIVLYGRGGDGQFSTEFNLSKLALVESRAAATQDNGAS